MEERLIPSHIVKELAGRYAEFPDIVHGDKACEALYIPKYALSRAADCRMHWISHPRYNRKDSRLYV
jgi:hypothetical protein